jgi:hypothetical protein
MTAQPTPLQLVAAELMATARNAQEMAEAAVAQVVADDHARALRVAEALQACPVTRRSRSLKGRCTR